MAATITLRQILIELVERHGLGTVVPVTSNTTTTFTLTTTGSPELRGPFTGKKIPVGTAVLCSVETSGTTALGNRTYVSDWNPSTGVITVSPAIGDTDVTEIILVNPEVGDSDRLIEAVNRGLQNRLYRWEMRPLTFVPDGDLQGTTVTDYWTAAANGTAAYATTQVFPATGAADAVGTTGLSRLVQLTSTGATSMASNGIRVVDSAGQPTWGILTAIRLVSGSGTVELVVRDNTNSADISLDVIRGADDNTFTTTTLGDFMVCEATFQQPDSCAEIAVQLELSAGSMVAQMAPVILAPLNAHSYPLPNRIRNPYEDVGNFRYAYLPNSPARWADMRLSEPVTTEGRQHWFEDYGDHYTVRFNFRPTRPIFYEEAVFGSALSAMTDTTTFPMDRVVRAAWAEFTDMMWTRKEHQPMRAENGAPLPNPWLRMRNNAVREANRYAPMEKTVVGRRG